ncbi:kinesin motor protein cin8 [Serendipita sp. 411]|nr:kinesin motor protein cin8 [Serendipita sp. 411]
MNVNSVVTDVTGFGHGEAFDGWHVIQLLELRHLRAEMASRRANAPDGPQRGRTISLNTNTRQKATFSSEVASTLADAPASAPFSSNAVASTASSSLLSKRTMSDMRGLPGLEPAECNIQVVVRCRGRSEREKSEGSANIITIDGPMAAEVVIQTAAPKTELGVTTPAATKTYPFDRVFGPAADQAMIYQEVVKPMLDEVLLGYNCTLFAYGQTGTGKTYTMQGDLTPSVSGGPSAGAGMIPRVLANLFAHLEANVPDYSVKVTYVELYNEELRDLLSPSLSGPVGSEQPMAKGSAGQYQSQAQAQANSKDGPKIFEDARGGVFIQGLEETFVKDAQEAIAQLRKGSERRQIAATKFNDHSSRSHSVFTVTVHTKTKETGTSGSVGGVPGEDYLRTGKLNLVDLAGSENIGRSGAENMRAREAGSINQSLLSLGRVINALVAKHSHIPYRESKLTRLLQDSLGGKTKTCIVANVSPAESNLEETFSTLDYALKAKSISNKPEVNQKMTRNSLLKEYIGLIECLKADLLAAREKNGIYMSKKSWDDMAADHTAVQQAHLEAKQQCDTLEAQLRVIREELTDSLGMLTRRSNELTTTKNTLEKTSAELAATNMELSNAVQRYTEETILKEAHQQTEENIDSVARGLKNVAQESVGDVKGLWDKMERKERVREDNALAVVDHTAQIRDKTVALTTGLDEFVGIQTNITKSMCSQMEQFKENELRSLGTLSTQVKASIQTLHDSISAISANEKEDSNTIDQIQELIQSTSEVIQTGFESWSNGLKNQCTTLFEELQTTVSESCQTAATAVQTSVNAYKALVDDTMEHLQREKDLIGETKSLVDETVDSEVRRLREQVTFLRQMLETEQKKTLKRQDDLLSNVASLVKEFTLSQNETLQATNKKVQEVVWKGAEGMQSLRQGHDQAVSNLLRQGDRAAQTISERAQRGKTAGDIALQNVESIDTKTRASTTKIQRGMESKVNKQMEEVRKQKDTLTKGANTSIAHGRQTKRARLALTEQMSTELQQGYRALQSGISGASTSTGQKVHQLLDEEKALRQAGQTYETATRSHLSSLRQATRALLEKGTREDVPTGQTPRKRTWEYDDEWERTKNRDAVLREWAIRQELKEQQKRDEIQRQLLCSTSTKLTASPERQEPVVPTEEDGVTNTTPAQEPVLAKRESVSSVDDIVTGSAAAVEINSMPPPPPYSKVPTIPVSNSRAPSRLGAPSNSRPPSKLGSLRSVSGKSAAPLTERNTIGTRGKKVR